MLCSSGAIQGNQGPPLRIMGRRAPLHGADGQRDVVEERVFNKLRCYATHTMLVFTPEGQSGILPPLPVRCMASWIGRTDLIPCICPIRHRIAGVPSPAARPGRSNDSSSRHRASS